MDGEAIFVGLPRDRQRVCRGQVRQQRRNCRAAGTRDPRLGRHEIIYES